MGASLCPWLPPVHLSPGMFSVLDFCTRQSCQESSCCPQLLSSFDPTSFLFLPWSLNFFHFGQLLSFAALLWAGKNSANENRKNKETRGTASALHVWRPPGSPLWGLSTHWVADRGGSAVGDQLKVTRDRPTGLFFSSKKTNTEIMCVEKSWKVLYFVFTHPVHTLRAYTLHPVWSDLYNYQYFLVTRIIYILFLIVTFRRKENDPFFSSPLFPIIQKLRGQKLLI